MFWKKEKSAAEEAKSLVASHANNSGTSRRAINMVPVAAISSSHEVAQTQAVRFHHLLISLEGNERTGCLKIISPKKKSRSAILIYRGRIVGCLYGRKNLDFQFLGADARHYALSDLASPGNVLDAYQLPEELVLAAASLFCGQVVDVPQHATPPEMLKEAVAKLTDSRLAGCVVVNNISDEMVCMLYLAAGKIIAIFSACDGWVEPTFETAMRYLNSARIPRVLASVLPANGNGNGGQQNIGFSLTGLGDDRQRWLTGQAQAVDALTCQSSVYSRQTPQHRQGAAAHSLAATRPRPATFAIIP